MLFFLFNENRVSTGFWIGKKGVGSFKKQKLFLFNESRASKLIHETRSFFCSMKIELQLALELVKKGSFKKQTLFLFNESRAAKLILLNFELVKKCNSRNKLFFTSMKIELQDWFFQILYRQKWLHSRKRLLFSSMKVELLDWIVRKAFI